MKKYKFPIENVEEALLKSVLISYSDHLEDNGHVAVTAWANGEGYDVDFNDNDRVGMTCSQWTALKLAMKRILKVDYLTGGMEPGKVDTVTPI